MVPVLLVWQEEIRNAVYLCSSGFFEYLTPQARGKMSVEVPYYLTVSQCFFSIILTGLLPTGKQ